jgi:ATP-dependent DNA helicase RecG
MALLVQLVQFRWGVHMTKESAVYHDRESKSLEFKSKLPEFSKLIKTCIAFANGVGGQIVIGVEDGSRRLVDITDKDRDRLYDEFPNSLYDAVSPTLIPQVYEKRIENNSVLIIQIPPGTKKPYYLKSEGLPKGVYVRVGSNTRRANQDFIEELVRESARVNFDEELIRKGVDVLSQSLLKNFYKSHVKTNRLLSDRVIGISGAGHNSFHPTVTGVLFFTDDPHLYLPEASVICTVFKGDSGREIILSQELTGPIDQLAVDSLQLVSSWLSRDYKRTGVRLTGKSLIPEDALREAIVNALIHRKYSTPGAVKIAIYENHLDIFSPGCFPGLVDLENLGDGTTFLRNPHIARIAHRMSLVEKLGSGIRLIFDSCKASGLKQPQYMEGEDSVKVTFFFERIRRVDQSDENAIASLIETHPEVSIAEVMKYLNVSRNTATRKLNNLVNQKRLIRVGKGPSVRYKSS